MFKKTPIKFIVIFILLIIFVLISSGAFYWFQIRPAGIKHDCSWITTHHDKTPAKPAKTEAEVFIDSKLSKEEFERALGLARGEIKPKSSTRAEDIVEYRRLSSAGQEMIRQMQGSPEIPASDETRQATDEEYKFCLRDKGL